MTESCINSFRLFMNTNFIYQHKDDKERACFSSLLRYLGFGEYNDVNYRPNYAINLDDDHLPLLVDKNEIIFGNVIVPFSSYADLAWCLTNIDFILQDQKAYSFLNSYRPDFYVKDLKIFYNELDDFEESSNIKQNEITNETQLKFYSSNPYERLIFIWGLLNLDIENINESDKNDILLNYILRKENFYFIYFAQMEVRLVEEITKNKMFIAFLNILKEISNQ